MSTFNTRADQLAAYLATVVGLESIVWIVDRDGEMPTEFKKATSKKHGAGLIRWMGGKNPDPKAEPIAINSLYKISLGVVPNLRKNKPAGDDLLELVVQAIHHWFPSDSPNKTRWRFEVLDAKPEENPPKGMQAFLITAQSVTQLPKATIETTP